MLPDSVLLSLTGRRPADVVDVAEVPLRGGTGAATAGVARLTAARQLGAWQASAVLPDVPWLGGHQLAQRVAVSDLDWSAVDADERAQRLWSRRHELLERPAALPQVLAHGDVHPDNLRADGPDTVALDWGTMGAAPVGADLAHLALGARADLLDDYLAGADGAFDRDQVEAGCRATLVLVGASRVHWMLATGADVPPGYVDFLWAHRP